MLLVMNYIYKCFMNIEASAAMGLALNNKQVLLYMTYP